jgi:acyl-CoA hydrolase
MERSVEYSRTEQVQLLMSEHMNGQGRLFGGKLMEWIDVVAGVVARRHSGSNVTTASVDRLVFLDPAYMGDTVVLDGRITYAGRTSMEVRVDTYVEKLSGERVRINRAYLVMVAVDDEGRPVKVPGLIIGNEDERAEWEAALRRREERKRG